jgi:hypothetical protein
MDLQNELPVKQTDVLLFLMGENPAELRRRLEIEQFMEMLKNQPYQPFQPQPFSPFQPSPAEIENIEDYRKRQMERLKFQWQQQQNQDFFKPPTPPSDGLQKVENTGFKFWRNKK